MPAGSPSQSDIDRMFERALQRLSQRPAAADPPAPPTRRSWDVRSRNTGAVVVHDIDRDTAARESERLNAEARQVLGVKADGATLHVGEQQGEITTYEAVAVDVLDENAYAEQLLEQADQIAARAKDATDEQADQLTGEAQRLRDQARGLRGA